MDQKTLCLSIITSFLHLIVLFCKVIINHLVSNQVLKWSRLQFIYLIFGLSCLYIRTQSQISNLEILQVHLNTSSCVIQLSNSMPPPQNGVCRQDNFQRHLWEGFTSRDTYERDFFFFTVNFNTLVQNERKWAYVSSHPLNYFL